MAGNGFPRVFRRGHRGDQEDNSRNGWKWQKMGCRGYLVGNGFPRVSRHGSRGSQAGNDQNGRKWQKKGCRGYLVGNGFPRVSRHGSRGSQEDHGQNGRKWSKMVEKRSPRENGRKWISARFTSFPYYFNRFGSHIPHYWFPMEEWKLVRYVYDTLCCEVCSTLWKPSRMWERYCSLLQIHI